MGTDHQGEWSEALDNNLFCGPAKELSPGSTFTLKFRLFEERCNQHR